MEKTKDVIELSVNKTRRKKIIIKNNIQSGGSDTPLPPYDEEF